MRRALLAAALAAASLWAQERTAAPLESIRITGNQRIPAEKILPLLALTIGKTVSRADFDAARQRLTSTGAFETVGYEYKLDPAGSGFDLTVEVHEVGEVFPYRFEGLGVDDNVLREAVRAQEPLWGDQVPISALTRYVDAVVQAGVKMAVTWKMVETAEGGTVVFQPAARPPVIAEVRFTGNAVLRTSALLPAINDVAVGTPYSEKDLREQLDAAIRPLYEARGRIGVAFPKIAIEPAEKVEGVVATVTVDEGSVYKLGEVRFTGVPESDAAQLARLADLRTGDTANFDDVKAAAGRVEKKYRDGGYLHASSKVEREMDDEHHSVGLTVAVELGAQYHFGKLNIEGLDLLTEPEIRKAWGAMEGKPYQPDYANAFLERLRTDKVFDSPVKSTAEPHVDEASKTVDVTLKFGGAVKDETRSEKNPFGTPPPEPGTGPGRADPGK
jgi:outer membrane protein insertion porin family